MTRTIQIFLLLFCLIAARQVFGYQVSYGGAVSVGTTFTEGTESKLLACGQGWNRFMLYNGGGATMEWAKAISATAAQTAGANGQINNGALINFDGYVQFSGSEYIYVRAASGTITSGVVQMLCPGH